MSKLKIAVVEDEIIIADNICDKLEDLGYIALEPAISYTEALSLIKNEKPNLVLIDIHLSGSKDGIELAWKIKDDYNIPFVFLTSNADKLTVERAKQIAPAGYILKPFSKEDLYTAIEIATYNHKKQNSLEAITDKDIIFIKDKQAFVKVKLNDVLYVKSDHVYVQIFLNNGKKFLVRGSLNEFMKRLNNNFLQIHRSFIVNMNKIHRVTTKNVEIADEIIPIGKKFKESFITRMADFF